MPSPALHVGHRGSLDGHALGQIPRLVDITALDHCDMICKELQRHNGDKRNECRMGRRHHNHVVRLVAEGSGRIRDHYDPSSPRFHLLDVRENFFVQALYRCQKYDGDSVLDQRYGALICSSPVICESGSHAALFTLQNKKRWPQGLRWHRGW